MVSFPSAIGTTKSERGRRGAARDCSAPSCGLREELMAAVVVAIELEHGRALLQLHLSAAAELLGLQHFT